MIDQSRRVFFKRMLVALVGLGAGGLSLRWGLDQRPEPQTLPADLQSLAEELSDLQDATVVAEAYLADYPEERDIELLSHALLGDVPSAGVRSDALKSNLSISIDTDYAESRTITIRNWVMSRTEARLCALVYLSASG